MAFATPDDLGIVLSGGQNNRDVNLSLGGNPSAFRISDGVINNLFDDVTPDESEEGLEDYRCVYLFNDAEGEDSTVYNIAIWIHDEKEGGSSIAMGMQEQNETQRITLSSEDPLTAGTFTISYDGYEFVSRFNSDLGEWAEALQEGLLELVDGDGNQLIAELTVTAEQTDEIIFFDLAFTGQEGKKNHPLFEIADNSLEPECEITVTVLQNGSPVNTITSQLDVDTTPPGGVNFSVPTEALPLIIPKLRSGEGFPFWFRRTTAAGAGAAAEDYVEIAVRSTSLLL